MEKKVRFFLDKIAVIVGDGLVLESQFNLKFQKYVQEFSKQNLVEEKVVLALTPMFKKVF